MKESFKYQYLRDYDRYLLLNILNRYLQIIGNAKLLSYLQKYTNFLQFANIFEMRLVEFNMLTKILEQPVSFSVGKRYRQEKSIGDLRWEVLVENTK